MALRKSILPLFLVSLFVLANPCFGQARIWVSGVGANANTGGRTDPVQTISGALAKTTAGAEIDALDEGDLGTASISYSVTIDGGPGLSGVTSTGASAFTITGTGTTPIVVTLRNLSINGFGQGTDGIDVSGAVILRVQNCKIFGFTGKGISFGASGTGSALFVQGTHIYDNGGDGIHVQPTSPAIGEIRDSQVEDCGNGVYAGSGAVVVAHNTSATGNTGDGFETASGGIMSIENGEASLNGTGILSAGKISLTDVTVSGNLSAGISHVSGGTIESFRNNAETNLGTSSSLGSASSYESFH